MSASTSGVYDGSFADRTARVKEFIQSLKFSVPLEGLQNVPRQECPKCKRRRLLYCYDCLVPCHAGHPAPLALPLQVHVLLHPRETRGKSTTLPAATISPDVHIHVYPELPDLNPAETIILYPAEGATPIGDLGPMPDVKNFVVVDSTWQQSKQICRDERIQGFRKVVIPQHVSLFWRFQNNDPSYLATIEAIYYSLRAVVTQRAGGVYKGEVDDLLLYYINQYMLVQDTYSQENKKFTNRHFDGYILEGADWSDLRRRAREEAGAPSAGAPSATSTSGRSDPQPGTAPTSE
jgi:DTW domain-containing protein YfiP